jgi:uncharacterized coiled-coil protein SlyX
MGWGLSDVLGAFHGGLQGGGDALGEIVNPILDPIHFALHDDPVKAIAQIAAITVSGGYYAAYALPLIEGADVAQNGGDIEKVLEAAAKVYVAQQVGSMAGEYAGTATQTATSSEVAGKIIGSTVGATASGIVLGQDPIEALKKGGVSAAIGASIGQLETNTGYDKLPPSAKAVINASITAAITDGELTPQALTAALVQATVTTNITNKYIKDNPDLSDAQQAILTDSITAASKAAFSEGNVTQAVMDSITNQGFKQLTASLDNLVKTGNVQGVRDSYDVLKTTASSITDESASLKQNIDEHNKLISEINPRFTERDRLHSIMESARVNDSRDPTVDTRTTLNNAITAYNEYATQLNDDYYNNYQTKIEDYKFKIDKSQLDITEFENTYEKQYNKLVASADKLDEDTAPIYSTAEKVFTLGMDETFKPDEYASLNNLSEDQDPYYHWLTIGKNDGLHTNNASYKNEYDQKQFKVLQNSLAVAGLNVTNLSGEQIKEGLTVIKNQSDGKIENLNNIDVTELGTNFGSNYLSMNPLNQVVGTADKLTLEDIKNKTSGFVSELIGINPAGASDLDIASGAAVISVNDDGGLEFKVSDPFAQWDNASGQKVSKEFRAPTSTADGYYTVKDTEGNVLDNIVIDSYTNFVNKGGYDIGEGSPTSAGAYAVYQESLGFETMKLTQADIGFKGVIDPTQTYTESEDGSYFTTKPPENSNIAGTTLADTFKTDPQSAVKITSGLSQDVKDTINEQVGLNVYDFTEALKQYASTTQPNVSFENSEILNSIGTEITQADIDTLNTAVSGMGGQESGGVEGSDVVQDTTGVGNYLGTIGDYQSQISELGGTITGLEGTIGEQEGTITGQQSSISEYLGTIGGLQDTLTGLQNTKTGLEGEIEGLEGTVGEQAGEIEGLEGYIGDTQQRFRQAGTMEQLDMLLQPNIVQPRKEPVDSEEELAKVIPYYDFSSIFRGPEQEKRYIRPYDETNAELLNLIKGGS